MKLVLRESIGMQCFDAPFLQFIRWKILQVGGDDHIRVAIDCRCQHMPVVWVRQRQPRDQRLEALNLGVPHRAVHQGSGALQLFCGQVGPVAQQCIGPFVMDGIGPSGEIKVSGGDFQQNIPNRRRIQNRRIQKYREPGYLQ